MYGLSGGNLLQTVNFEQDLIHLSPFSLSLFLCLVILNVKKKYT